MPRFLILIALFLSALVAGQGPSFSSLRGPKKGDETILVPGQERLERNCQDIKLIQKFQPIPPKPGRPPPRLPPQLIQAKGRRRGRDNIVRLEVTSLDLDKCLGWSTRGPGSLVPKSSGNGLMKGGCTSCRYQPHRPFQGETPELDYNMACWCRNVPKKTFANSDPVTGEKADIRYFNLDRVIAVKNGRLTCFERQGELVETFI
ncbi:hypothetical protein BDV28DRAFT_145365 [Aspergillus coremiiformis]|uniref:Cyanovirin-N domain-containing protein n=1 Tax=Aspergillus coremiiformis TaxID=138285 RepID=A0A5N6ZJ40_9EURO|nr:hypothetical protein BDV28DRAFT_145365 [Aspergillus coremiiformis]